MGSLSRWAQDVVRLFVCTGLVATFFAATVPPASAHVSSQVGDLSGDNVIPKGSGAPKGKGRVEIRSASEISTVCYKLAFLGIGKATSAHIHEGTKGEVGPVAVQLFESNQGVSSPQDGCVRPVSAGLIEAMQTHPQSYYVDVHTAKNSEGAIRGQLRNVAGSYSPPSECGPFRPAKPQTRSAQGDEALKAKVRKITDASTEKYPAKMKYGFSTSLWEWGTRTPIVEDTAFFNVQVDTADVGRGLYVSASWPSASASDIDIIVYDGTGAQVATSDTVSVLPQDPPQEIPILGPSGYEVIEGFPAADCSGYTIELRAIRTLGEDVQLRVWLGEER